jgi:ferrous iron transport protein B
LWALSAFPRAARVSSNDAVQAAAQIEGSALGRLGHAVEPVFRPIGYDWKLSVAVISSLAAREVFVGTLGTLFSLSGDAQRGAGLVEALASAKDASGLPRYGLPTAVSLLLFFAVALQCVSTIAVVRRETGSWTWPAAQFSCFFAVAYALAFAGYHLALHWR